jgi:hypothetical protein
VHLAWMMPTFIADEFARKKFSYSDIRYATLKILAGVGWIFSATGQIAKTDASSLASGLFCSHQAQVGGGTDLSRLDKTNFLKRR